MTWKVDQGLSIGYKMRPVATVTQEILFESEIPVAPSRILLVSEGKIWPVPPEMSWSEIRVLLQRPKFIPV